MAFGLARPAPPLRCGRRIDFPKGDHRRPPAFLSSANWGLGFWVLSISAILAILSVLGWSWAALGVVLQHLAASWGGLGTSGVAHGASWGALGVAGVSLGASWGALGGS